MGYSLTLTPEVSFRYGPVSDSLSSWGLGPFGTSGCPFPGV